MQNNGDRLHCRYLSSRGEGEAVNQPIIEESAPLFHHILANPYLSFGPASPRQDEPRALRRAGGRTALLTTHYDIAAAELFRSIGAHGRIISIERRASCVPIGNASYESGTARRATRWADVRRRLLLSGGAKPRNPLRARDR